MKFGDILIENCLSIQNARVVLGARGLVNVEGCNKDDPSASSNGAGKSSIFDALFWCLFNETARGVTGDAIVNRLTGKGCKVDVELLEGDEQWKVIRHRKHKTGKNALHLWHYDAAGVATDLTQGTDALTQAKVVEVLGCSKEVFKGAVYSGQEQMPDLPGMTDKNLKVLVEEASGTTLLDRGHRLALDAVTVAKITLAANVTRLDRAHDSLASVMSIIADTKARQTAWEASRAGRVLELARDARAHAAEAKTHAAALALLDAPSVKSEIATLDAGIAAVDVERAEVKRLTQIISETHGVSVSAKTRETMAEQAVRRAQTTLDGLDHKIGCPCSGCDRPFAAEDIAPAKRTAQEALNAATIEADARKRDADAASKAFRDANTARTRFEATMTDLSATLAARDAANRTLAVIEKHASDQAAWTRSAREKIAELNRIKVELNPFDAVLTDAEAKRVAASDAVGAADLAVESAEEGLRIEQDVCLVFAPGGVRAQILDTVTPFLNDRTARYLGTLSDGNINATWATLVKNAKGELKEKFAIEVDNDNGGATFLSLSGGEKRKVRVACALALQDLVASRATKAIELFIGDELDDALDAAGLERLMTILEEKARERGSVFIISHSSLRDWIRTTIVVTKENKISTIAEAA